jgi:hypothetical protein
MLKSDWIKSHIIPGELNESLIIRLNELIEIDNPIKVQPVISAPVDINKLWDIVPPVEVFKVLNTLIWDRVVLAIAANNKSLVARYVAALVAGGCLAPATAVKIGAALSGSIPDPTWQARILVPAYQIAGFASLTIDDVEAALSD